mmetsp:Transcript_102233/g.305195  ORF Transcript_102233/g.305195 Transcript_102233/m.305195 type:complete len:233 (-) Transcript_102233:3-701(-)
MLNEDLAPRVVGVRSKLNLPFVLLEGEPAVLGSVPRARVQQAVERDDRLELMARADLLEQALPSEAVANGPGGPRPHRRVPEGGGEVRGHQCPPVRWVPQEGVHGGVRARLVPAQGAPLSFLQRLGGPPVRRGVAICVRVLGEVLVQVHRKAHIAGPGQEASLVDVKLLQAGVVGVHEHDRSGRPSPDKRYPAVGVGVPIESKWEGLHHQFILLALHCAGRCLVCLRFPEPS